jgi:transposase
MSRYFVGADGPLSGGGLDGLLADDDPVWAMADLVDRLDLSVFEAAHRSDGSGGRAYDPRLMLTLVLHCYRLGIRSPAGIARACYQRIDLRVFLGGRVPAGRTVSRFVVRHAAAWPGVFVEVLALCDQRGLVDVAVTATDGSPVGAAASLSANHTVAWITEQAAAVQQHLDELDAQAAGAADALAPGADLDEYIGLVCGSIPVQARVAQRRLTRLRQAQAVAAARAVVRSDSEAGELAVRVARAQAWLPRHERTLARMVSGQDAKVADYAHRAAIAAHHGRRPDGRVPTPTDQCVHIVRQRQALTDARQRLANLRKIHHL